MNSEARKAVVLLVLCVAALVFAVIFTVMGEPVSFRLKAATIGCGLLVAVPVLIVIIVRGSRGGADADSARDMTTMTSIRRRDDDDG